MTRPALSADEAARRLGVKRQTLYAYVSRRPPQEQAGRRWSRQRVRRRRGGRPVASISRRAGVGAGAHHLHVGDVAGGRGVALSRRLVSGLAATEPFESVATFLWTGTLAWEPCLASPRALATVESVRDAMAPGARLIDRLRLIADLAAIADPLRFDLTPAAVVASGRALLGVLVDGLSASRRRRVPLTLPGQPPRPDALATRLWPRLSTRPAQPGGIRAVNGALVLTADHELATSTFAARLAASTARQSVRRGGDGPRGARRSPARDGERARARHPGGRRGGRARPRRVPPAPPRRSPSRLRPPALSRWRPSGHGVDRPAARGGRRLRPPPAGGGRQGAGGGRGPDRAGAELRLRRSG